MAIALMRLTTGVVYARSISGTLTFVSGGVLALAAGTAAVPSLTFAIDTDTGWFSRTANVLGLAIGGAQTVDFFSTEVRLAPTVSLTWGVAVDGPTDTVLCRGGANIIGIGGCTSSFPAIKRSTTEIHARLADDSAYTTVDALGYEASGTKVVGAQGAAVADAAGGTVVDVEARAALNALLARLRTHGLIAT